MKTIIRVEKVVFCSDIWIYKQTEYNNLAWLDQRCQIVVSTITFTIFRHLNMAKRQ